MTYIEFFDKTASENISACLTDVPERVILIGDNGKLMERHISYYKRVFADRGHENVEFLYRSVSKSNLNNAIALIEKIVETYPNCVFDITGGEEILTLALGVVYERYPEKKIQIHRFNLRNNKIYDCDQDGVTIYKNTPTLSVEENIRIFGGDVVYGTIEEDNTYLWDLTPEFKKDIDLIWAVCKRNVRLWNTQIGVFEAAVEVGSVSEDGLTVTASIERISAYLAKYKASYKIIKGLTGYLLKQRLLTQLDEGDGSFLTLGFKNKQVKKCLTKAGQALEMKIYITAKDLLETTGEPVYNDVVNGVVIDWDGDFHDEETEDLFDTENEIDILMMHDIVPVFVSCKNGVVTAEELYKLHTVAERFGGQYSKKVLVATSVSELGRAGKYLRQRAKDMNIKLIENVQDLDDHELAKKLHNLWNN